MEILTEHLFFRVLDGSGEPGNMKAAYMDFTREVFILCGKDSRSFMKLVFTLNYTCIELTSLGEQYSQDGVGKKCGGTFLYPQGGPLHRGFD